MVGTDHAEYGHVGADDGEAPPRQGYRWAGGARTLLSLAMVGALAMGAALSQPGRMLRARGASGLVGLVANDPYQCTWSYGQGEGSWETTWSDEQREWCCKNKQLGCPTPPLFDCEAGYENRKFGWSPIKMTWCCVNAKKGCNDNICRVGTPAPGPTLYCVTIARSHGYEPELLGAQLEKCVHIFSCDGWAVVSDKTVVLPAGKQVETLAYSGPQLASVAGESHNAEQFRGFWDVLKREGRYKSFDFTVKADPDTVFFPDRLKSRLAGGYSGDDATIFASCGPASTHPLNTGKGFLYGAIEVMSRGALVKFFDGLGDCEVGEKHQVFEETMITDCMQKAGVGMDYGLMEKHLLGDGDTCKNFAGGSCTGEWVAIHPYSGIEPWFKCWREATAAPPEQQQQQWN